MSFISSKVVSQGRQTPFSRIYNLGPWSTLFLFSIDFLLPGHYRVGLSTARVMDEDGGVVVSLGDCVGPFQAYVEGGEE